MQTQTDGAITAPSRKYYFKSFALLLSFWTFSGFLSAQDVNFFALGGPRVAAGAFGARGDGVSDDTVALQYAIDTMPDGATLDFGGPDRTYLISRRLTLKPRARYTGQATIRMRADTPPGTQMMALKYDRADDVTVDGLTLDANGVGGGIAISVDGGGDIPSQRVNLTGLTFLRTFSRPRGGYDTAIFNPVGMISSNIERNRFIQCGGGISLANVQDTTIQDNSFTDILNDNAIYVLFTPARFDAGKRIQIRRNSGSGLTRMAVELWGRDITHVESPVIADNSFTGWRPEAKDPAFGISVMVGTGAQIINNTLVAGRKDLGFGIEVGAPQSNVVSNYVDGFAVGAALHDSSGTSLTSNLFVNQQEIGIQLTNAPGTKRNLNISQNNIWNPRHFGFWANTVDWGGSTVAQNCIMRLAGAWPDDDQVAFSGIVSTPPTQPVTVSNNLVLQYADRPNSRLSFLGIRLNGAQQSNSGSRYTGNSVQSASPIPFGVGLMTNSYGGADGLVFENNHIESMQTATAGATSPGIQARGNRLVNCGALGPVDINK